MAGERQTEPHRAADWRCECGDLNRGHEAFCYRCGAGQPDEPQTEPRQAEDDRVWLSSSEAARNRLPGIHTRTAYVPEAEVARLRAERDAWKRKEFERCADVARERNLSEAAEARVAELEQANDDMRGNLESERAQAAVEIEQLRQAQNRVAELEAERDRLKDESRIGWLESALKREQALRTAAEDRIDRAVTEQRTAIVAFLRSTEVSPPAQHLAKTLASMVEREFLAPTRTREACVERSHRDGDGDRRGVSSPPPPACEQRDSDGCAERGPTNPGGQ